MGAHLPGTLRERCRRKLSRRVSVYVGAHWGTWRVCWLGILRDSWRAPEREHLSLRELLGSFLSGDPEGHGEVGSGEGHNSPWGQRWGS